jgi:hypothetical protein
MKERQRPLPNHTSAAAESGPQEGASRNGRDGSKEEAPGAEAEAESDEVSEGEENLM